MFIKALTASRPICRLTHTAPPRSVFASCKAMQYNTQTRTLSSTPANREVSIEEWVGYPHNLKYLIFGHDASIAAFKVLSLLILAWIRPSDR